MDGSVRKMLELSRLETGVQALRREEFPLAALAQERAYRRAPGRRQTAHEFASDNEYTVNADRALLARALDALLENAVQHTPEGGCITVRIANGMLSVGNTGDAIPDHALPRLWEAYYQADPSRSTKGRRSRSLDCKNRVRFARIHLRRRKHRCRSEILVQICIICAKSKAALWAAFDVEQYRVSTVPA